MCIYNIRVGNTGRKSRHVVTTHARTQAGGGGNSRGANKGETRYAVVDGREKHGPGSGRDYYLQNLTSRYSVEAMMLSKLSLVNTSTPSSVSSSSWSGASASAAAECSSRNAANAAWMNIIVVLSRRCGRGSAGLLGPVHRTTTTERVSIIVFAHVILYDNETTGKRINGQRLLFRRRFSSLVRTCGRTNLKSVVDAGVAGRRCKRRRTKTGSERPVCGRRVRRRGAGSDAMPNAVRWKMCGCPRSLGSLIKCFFLMM